MPPAMTSIRGGTGRSSSISGTHNGSIPRREPLRRLYPLQRGRTTSDSFREISGFSDENMPAAILIGAADKKGSLSKHRGQQVIGIQSGNPIITRTLTVPEYKTVQQYASPDCNGRDISPAYSRPSLIRRSSDVGSVSSYGSSCPVHGDSSISSATNSLSSSSQQGSILKRPSSARSHHSHSQSNRSKDLNGISLKQVQFCPNVSVVQMDEDGEHLSTHFQELNGEKRKRLGTISRQSSKNYDNVFYFTEEGLQDRTSQEQRRSSSDHHMSSQSQSPRDGRFRDLFKRLNSSSGSVSVRGDQQGEENVPHKKGEFNITFSNRPKELTKLRFVLHMGHGYNPNDLIVKANTTGSRIRVLATRTDRNSHIIEEFNEKYMLPMDIDPYEIEARLDKWGNLTVEAPLLTVDKRAEVNKPNNVLCAIYV